MKKIICVLLTALLAFSFAACDTGEKLPPSVAFDENSIVLTFAAMSDVHESGTTGTQQDKKFRAALDLINSLYDVDALLFAGDLTDGGTAEHAAIFGSVIEEYYPDGIPVIYALGNHDGYGGNGPDLYPTVYPEFFYSADIDKDSIDSGNRHAVVNGYHFITLEVTDYCGSDGKCHYSEETIEWLRGALSDAAADDPSKPIFFATHAQLYGTVYGSDLPGSGTCWYSDELNGIFAEYPQCVTFAGHVHYPLNDERSISQTGFTSLGTGSVYYMAIDPGYTQTGAGAVTADCKQVSNGLVLEVDANNNVRITRLDFIAGEIIKTPWEISAPGTSGANKNYDSSRTANNAAPSFANGVSVELLSKEQYSTGLCSVAFKITSAVDDDLVHHYYIEVSKDGSVVSSFKTFSDFYLHADPADMSDTTVITLSNLPGNSEFTVTVRAVDSFGLESKSFSFTVNTPGAAN